MGIRHPRAPRQPSSGPGRAGVGDSHLDLGGVTPQHASQVCMYVACMERGMGHKLSLASSSHAGQLWEEQKKDMGQSSVSLILMPLGQLHLAHSWLHGVPQAFFLTTGLPTGFYIMGGSIRHLCQSLRSGNSNICLDSLHPSCGSSHRNLHWLDVTASQS